jgi:hypothetical protein
VVHEVFDIARWKAMFPLAQLRDAAWQRELEDWERHPAKYVTPEAVEQARARSGPRAEAVTSPYDLAVLEQLREEALAEVAHRKRVPTDVFIFSAGEPERREVTKVGGLPYWPVDRPWPRTVGDRPMTFVVQFCFADSRDIVGHLPGDILLVFVDYEAETADEKSALKFEWVQLGEISLIDSESIPETGTTVTPCYGAIYRTFDSPGSEPQESSLWQIEGTKIGGVPHWIQHSQWPWRRFLCACGSIQPAFGQPYPYLNVSEPRTRFCDPAHDNELMWGDAGSLYIFRGPFNAIRGTVQYY